MKEPTTRNKDAGRRLRNKKTGEIGDLIGTERNCPYITIGVDFHDGNPRSFDYTSLTELNEEWEDYEPTEPDPSFLVVKIQKLENSIKALDERLKAQTEKMGTLRDGINELHDRLKTTEEITERLLREDNERIFGKVKQYEPGMPQRVIFERMKQDLRDWIEKNKIDSIQTFIHTEPDGRRGVKFSDMTNDGSNHLIIVGWPAIGLVDGACYTPDELLITGEAGKE